MASKADKPNILILWGDDIGWWNISYNNRGQMGYRTPNIDRIGNEGMTFTDYYGQQSCTANPHIGAGHSHLGEAGADWVLTGDERGSAAAPRYPRL
jgi:arylsulfatase